MYLMWTLICIQLFVYSYLYTVICYLFVYSFDADVNITGSTFHMSDPSSEDGSVDDPSSSASDESDSDNEMELVVLNTDNY